MGGAFLSSGVHDRQKYKILPRGIPDIEPNTKSRFLNRNLPKNIIEKPIRVQNRK